MARKRRSGKQHKKAPRRVRNAFNGLINYDVSPLDKRLLNEATSRVIEDPHA